MSHKRADNCMLSFIRGTWNRFTEIQSANGGCQELQEVENEGLVFKGNRVSIWDDENSSTDGWLWQLPNNVNRRNATELYIEK